DRHTGVGDAEERGGIVRCRCETDHHAREDEVTTSPTLRELMQRKRAEGSEQNAEGVDTNALRVFDVQWQNGEDARRDGACAPPADPTPELEDDRYRHRAEDGREHLKCLQILRLVNNEVGEEIDRRVKCTRLLADEIETREEARACLVEEGRVKEVARIAS